MQRLSEHGYAGIEDEVVKTIAGFIRRGDGCQHRAPMALVPLMIRWGMDVSTDMLRKSAVCTRCGRKGATLQHPSWGGSHVGFQEFPVEYVDG
jgi:hypothetical protein